MAESKSEEIETMLKELELAALKVKDLTYENVLLEAEKDDAWTQLNNSQKELAAAQGEVTRLKEQAIKDAEELKTKQSDYNELCENWNDDQVTIEILKQEVEQHKASKEAAKLEAQMANKAADNERTSYIQLSKDVRKLKEQREENLKQEQGTQLGDEGNTVVTITDFDRYKEDSALLALRDSELEGLKRHLDYYDKNDRALKFASNDTPLVSDIAALTREPEHTISHELSQRDTAETGTSAEFERYKNDSALLSHTRSELEKVKKQLEYYEKEHTSIVRDIAAGPAPPSASPVQLTTTISGLQSTSPIESTTGTTTGSIVQTSPGKFTIVIGAPESIVSTPGARPATVSVTSSEPGAQIIQIETTDTDMQNSAPATITTSTQRAISTRRYGMQTDDTIPEDEVIVSKKTIRHHSLVGCFLYTTKDMLVITIKYSRPLTARVVEDIRLTFPVAFDKLDQVVVKWVDPVNESGNEEPPSLLDIMRNPDIVDMPPVASTSLDSLSYLCFFVFLFQCWIARSWVVDMLDSNGMTRKWFADLYTHRHSHGRGIMPAVFPEHWVGFWHRSVLALTRWFGHELEPYARAG